MRKYKIEVSHVSSIHHSTLHDTFIVKGATRNHAIRRCKESLACTYTQYYIDHIEGMEFFVRRSERVDDW